jgi:hypothetical protein
MVIPSDIPDGIHRYFMMSTSGHIFGNLRAGVPDDAIHGSVAGLFFCKRAQMAKMLAPEPDGETGAQGLALVA